MSHMELNAPEACNSGYSSSTLPLLNCVIDLGSIALGVPSSAWVAIFSYHVSGRHERKTSQEGACLRLDSQHLRETYDRDGHIGQCKALVLIVRLLPVT